MTRIARTCMFLAGLAIAIAHTACRGHAPSDILDGTWRGTIADNVSGNGTIELNLTGRGPGVSGTWTATFDISGETRVGPATGTFIGSNVSIVLSYDAPMVCAGGERLESRMVFNGALVDVRLSGPYVMLVCSGLRTGTIDVVHQ